MQVDKLYLYYLRNRDNNWMNSDIDPKTLLVNKRYPYSKDQFVKYLEHYSLRGIRIWSDDSFYGSFYKTWYVDALINIRDNKINEICK